MYQSLVKLRADGFRLESLGKGDLGVMVLFLVLGMRPAFFFLLNVDASRSCGEAFSKGVGFRVGEESRVWFRVDNWMGLDPMSMLFPRVFRVMSNKKSFVKSVMLWRTKLFGLCLLEEDYVSQKSLCISLCRVFSLNVFCAGITTFVFGDQTHQGFSL